MISVEVIQSWSPTTCVLAVTTDSGREMAVEFDGANLHVFDTKDAIKLFDECNMIPVDA